MECEGYLYDICVIVNLFLLFMVYSFIDFWNSLRWCFMILLINSILSFYKFIRLNEIVIYVYLFLYSNLYLKIMLWIKLFILNNINYLKKMI